MSYSLNYKLAGEDRYIDAVGEININSLDFVIVEKEYNTYEVYLLNQEEELDRVEDEVATYVLNKWKSETYSPVWDDEYEDENKEIYGDEY